MEDSRPQQHRQYRQRRDVLQEYSDEELIKRFRLDSGGIIAVTDLIRQRI